MAKHPRAHPPEFRRKILELVRAGRSLNALAKEFSVSRQSIANWVRQDDLDAGKREHGLTTGERQELTKLRRENKRLKMESEILSKAAVDSRDRRNTRPMSG